MIFQDRRAAGRLLAERLLALKDEEPVVLALPRGGVPVAFEIAAALAAPLDLVLVRKIGAPQNPELAIGAIADGADPELVVDQRLAKQLHVSAAYLEEAKTAALAEIERRRLAWLGDHAPLPLTGRTVIVVDDGIATGATMRAALRATRRRQPARIVLAVPVASDHAVQQLRGEADQVVCLDVPEEFLAVGQFYRRFPQLQDSEVTALLDQARALLTTG